jgi:hypothetical protein
MDPNIIMNRIMRLAKLDTSPFDEVRDDQRETVPAIVIVAVSALLASLGATLWLLLSKPDGLSLDWGHVILKIWLLGTIITVIMWAVWVAVTAVFLSSFYKEQAEIPVLMRTMGYAAFPFALSILMLLPFLSFGIGVVALAIWAVLSTFAVQAATTADSDRVIKANLVGFLVFAVLLSIFARGVGISSGVFVNAENTGSAGPIFDSGKYYKVDTGSVDFN